MTLPCDWLRCPTTPDEVEADLAELGAPDIWLQQWRALRNRMAPGDELWEYIWLAKRSIAVVASAERIPEFEQIIDYEALEELGLADPFPIPEYPIYRDGFAVVRGGAILDWIESPW